MISGVQLFTICGEWPSCTAPLERNVVGAAAANCGSDDFIENADQHNQLHHTGTVEGAHAASRPLRGR